MRHDSDQIVRAHDACELAVSEHVDAMDSLGDHESPGLAQGRAHVHRDWGVGHHVADARRRQCERGVRTHHSTQDMARLQQVLKREDPGEIAPATHHG